MKRLLLITCVAVLASAQTSSHYGDLRLTSLNQERDGAVIHLKGQVTIENDAIRVQADEADYNADTGEIQAHGDVRVKLK